MIALAEQALDHARADLRRSEYGAEAYRRREVDASRLQENQQMNDDDRADAGGNREHQRKETENQGFIIYSCRVGSSTWRSLPRFNFPHRTHNGGLQREHDEKVNRRID